MQDLWYALLAVMLAVYVVLDGFDFGAGILHLFVAKDDADRRTVLQCIGPVWDGNEVWLLASGGVLVLAFPKAYAAGFSGFYLPLMMALWLLIMRGISIEFRSHHESPLWRSFWDGVFALSSILMAVILGAALGNVIRGVPLDATGYFAGPLFTDFRLGAHPGVLDWYTVTIGVFTLAALAAHGAVFLAWKAEGPVHQRARRLVAPLWGAVAALGIVATVATAVAQPALFPSVAARPWAWPLALLIPAGLLGVFWCHARGKELPAFLCSAAFLIAMLAATAAGFYPYLLVSTLDPRYSLTASSAASTGIAMRVALWWWIPAMALVAAYFTYLFRSIRGKTRAEAHGPGY
jgi:cytochrome d ubiquinol oxidase subunit II